MKRLRRRWQLYRALVANGTPRNPFTHMLAWLWAGEMRNTEEWIAKREALLEAIAENAALNERDRFELEVLMDIESLPEVAA